MDNLPILVGSADDYVPDTCPQCGSQICVAVAEYKQQLMWLKDGKYYIERQISPTNFDVIYWECGSCKIRGEYELDEEWIKIPMRDVVRK
jgi:hypothetical protein